VLLLVVLFGICAYFCRAKEQTLYFPHLEALWGKSSHQGGWLTWLKWITILCAIVALASPVGIRDYQHLRRQGRDIVLIIDTSESMKQARFDQKEMTKNKFTVVQEVVSDFVASRVDDRIGLVSFADVAFVAAPLTFEREFLQQIVIMQKLGIAGKRTAINDAIVQSYHLLSSSKARSKIAILLTDGMDNMSRIPQADLLTLVAKSPIKLYTIGVGSSRDYDGAYLETLAKAGGGKAFSASSASALSEIYRKIDQLETSTIEAKSYQLKRYYYFYPLFVAMVGLLLFLYLKNRKGRRV